MTDVVTVERVIPAPAERIFALLVDPSHHCDIDGSGTVVATNTGATRLKLGDRFGMDMKMGVPYSMVSTVIELEDDRCIAWQTRGKRGKGGGRIWRYELEPVDGGTRVTESWDIRTENRLSRPMVRLGAGRTRKAMAATLERIEQLVRS
jgi:uncharacterized protein YndB with AHSA1/START domain